MSERIAWGAAIAAVVIALGLGLILSLLDSLAPPGRGVAVFLFVCLGAGVTLALLYMYRRSISATQLRRLLLFLAVTLAALFLCLIGWYAFSENCIIYATRNPPYEEPFVYFPLYLSDKPTEKVAQFGSRAGWASDNTPNTVRTYLEKMPGRVMAYAVTDAVLFFLCFAVGGLVAFEIGLPSVYLAATSRVIRDLASRVGAERGEFERVVLKKIGFINVRKFAAQLLERARCVCRCDMPKSSGTAFLVGPDLIITNHHVIKNLTIVGGESSERVVIRFDQDEMLLGTEDAPIREYRLANNWLLEFSEPLDYAILRMSARAGEEEITDGAARTPRGWVRLKAVDVEPSESLFILQHPNGEELRLAVGSVARQEGDKGEVSYTTSTDRGSSGSPCFDTRLDIVALHYWGSKELNRGKLISAILDDLKAKNRLELLTGEWEPR
jgi:hypothetical protein